MSGRHQLHTTSGPIRNRQHQQNSFDGVPRRHAIYKSPKMREIRRSRSGVSCSYGVESHFNIKAVLCVETSPCQACWQGHRLLRTRLASVARPFGTGEIDLAVDFQYSACPWASILTKSNQKRDTDATMYAALHKNSISCKKGLGSAMEAELHQHAVR